MMCVKDTLPPRERARWLLMTTRLSMSSLAGTARTLVAVGTPSELSMLATTRAAGPRSGLTSSSLTGPLSLTAGMSRGLGGILLSAGRGVSCFGAAGGVGAAGAAAVATFASAGGESLRPAGFEAVVDAAEPLGAPFVVALAGPPPAGLKSAKNAHQALSTEDLSVRYCWYNSSTSHSFGPKAEIGSVVRDWSGTANTPLS